MNKRARISKNFITQNRVPLWGSAILVLILLGMTAIFLIKQSNVRARQISPLQQTNTPTAETAQGTPVPNLPTVPVEKDGMPMVFVPVGEFSMGAASTDVQAALDEKPQHTVFLDAFWIDKTEVTNQMYAQCVGSSKCNPPESVASSLHTDYYKNPQFAQYPMVNVSWEEARTYCAWAGRHLPTEAQWEKAARGTDGRRFPWGNLDASPDSANFDHPSLDTAQVGSYPKGLSPYGALDMAGNVWEWVADWYSATYYQNSASKDPTGPETGTMRIIRGGSYYNQEFTLHAAFRLPYDPALRRVLIGFRCAQSLSTPKPFK